MTTLLVCACSQQASPPGQVALALVVGAPTTAADAGMVEHQLTQADADDADDADGIFERLAPPAKGEWRALHPEPGQSVAEFIRDRPHRPTKARKTIYLAFVSGQPRDATPNIHVLAAFAQAFFGLPTKVLPERKLSARGLSAVSSVRFDARTLRRALARHLPHDALAMIGITDVDLTSRTIGTIFGEASARHRIGLVSIARLHLSFYEYGAPSNKRVVLRRSLALLAHEVGHLLGIEHCTAYRCVMNESARARQLAVSRVPARPAQAGDHHQVRRHRPLSSTRRVLRHAWIR